MATNAVTASEFGCCLRSAFSRACLTAASSRCLPRRCSVDNGVAVAVSGGSDSTALCWVASQWARRRGVRLQAFTVDHGLRAESRREATGPNQVLNY